MLRRMKAFETRTYGIVIPPYFNGESFVYPGSVVIPTHDAYCIQDLQNAGLLSPVSTIILHDGSVVDGNVASLIDAPSSSSDVSPENVSPSNND